MIKRLFALQASSLVMAVLAIVSFVTVYNLLSSFNWVNHTYQVIGQVNRVKDDIADCQTSVRETVFGGDKKNLSLYLAKSPVLEVNLDNLQWLTRDNENQQRNVYNLRQNVTRRLEKWREALDLFNQGKLEESKQFLLRTFNEPWFVSTRNLTEIIESEEQRLLDMRLLDYKNKSNIVLYGIPLIMLIDMVVVNGTARSIQEKMKNC